MKTVYQADDGLIFQSKEACRNHEDKVKLIEEIVGILNKKYGAGTYSPFWDNAIERIAMTYEDVARVIVENNPHWMV